MNIFLFEMKSSVKSLAVWIVSIVGFYIFAMSMFPSFAGNTEGLETMLASFPQEMLKALNLDIIDFSKPMDYMTYIFQYIIIALGALSILTGSGIIAKEEDEKTIEFLYAKPVSRTKIFIAKALAGLFQIMIIAVVFYLSTVIIMAIVADGVSQIEILRISTGLLFFMILFFAVGLLIGQFITKGSKRLPIVLGILFLMFLISVMSDMNEKFEILKFFTPFQYFNGLALIKNGLKLSYSLISAMVIILSTSLAWIIYKRKDL
ncbi:MAG: ABC transporter permease subunit [Spirochaetales bacterium]|nr:ABC transporter permease subunit [Spirochaetales bacterium]